MGIKDNFSQAVKELWKKDGQGDNTQQSGNQPSELDKYLRQNGGQTTPPAGVEVNSNGVPLETPYYPNQNPQSNQDTQNIGAANNGAVNMASNPADANPAAPAENVGIPNVQSKPQEPAGTAAEEASINRNVRNVQQNMGQNNGAGAQDSYNRNAGFPQGGYVTPNGAGTYQNQGYGQGNMGGIGGNGGYGGNNGYVPPVQNPAGQMNNETEEITIISKNTSIDGNVRSLANMQIDGNVKGNVETTRNVDMTGKIIGDITCNNAAMNSAAMQGNVSLKGRMKMDRDTILIGDLSSQYADINGRIRGKLDIVGKAELKRDAIVFGDINASTIAVTDGAIIQGYVNTTFLSKEDSRNVFPDAISLDTKDGKQNVQPNPSET